MIHVRICTLACLLYLSTQNQYYQSPLGLYVADSNSTTVFKEHAAKRQMIGVLFTNKYCRQCHFYQDQMQQIIRLAHHKENIKIYRSQLGSNPGLQQQFSIKRFPMLHFVLPNSASYKIYFNSEIVTKHSISLLIKKLKYYMKLNADITNLDQLYVNAQELTYADQSLLFQAYGLNSNYQQLPLLRFLNNDQFKKLLNQQKIQFFDMSTCLVYHLQSNKCFEPKNMQQFASLLSFITFQKVNQFTQGIYKHFQQLQLNSFVFVAVLDSIFLRQKSTSYKEMLNALLKRRDLSKRVVIFWMQAQINKQKLKHLGFPQAAHPPLFAHFDLSRSKKQVFHKSQEHYAQKQILTFIKSIINIDEQLELKQWNNQLLIQSLKRLGLFKKIQILDQLIELKQEEAFVLSVSSLPYQLLSDKEVLYQPILSFNYFIRRVQRFSNRRISRFITFAQIQCQQDFGYGFYLFRDNRCLKISNRHLTKVESFPQLKIEQIRKIYDLPEYFWINQNDLAELYPKQSQQQISPEFSYVQIYS